MPPHWLASLDSIPPVGHAHRSLGDARNKAPEDGIAMATHYSSGQYEDAYEARNLHTWTRPKIFKEHPSAREGYTQFVADDRGHLLPSIPRSQVSPWGTYLGTWDMPLRLPPAQVNLTSRSVAAAAHLTEWINKSSEVLSKACNGCTPEIIGKPNDPPIYFRKEPSAKCDPPASKCAQRSCSAEKMPAQEEGQPRGASSLKGPLSRQPGCMDIRLKEEALPDAQPSPHLDTKDLRQRSANEVPLSRQPGCMDVRLKEPVGSPKLQAPSRPGSRDPAARRAISAEAPPSARPRSLEVKTKGLSTPELLASCRPGSMEAHPKSPHLAEAVSSSRSTARGGRGSEVQKTPDETDAERREKGVSPEPFPCPEERSN